MKKYDVIIIGAGLGGLECGYIMSKKGYNVCILEKHFQVGGCLQTFKRGATTFDTGFHFVGGLSDGQPLNRLFKRFVGFFVIRISSLQRRKNTSENVKKH